MKFYESAFIPRKGQGAIRGIVELSFHYPKYNVLIREEFTRKFFEDSFKLSFMPSREEKLKRELSKRDPRAKFLEHYVQVNFHKAKLPEMVRETASMVENNMERISSLLNQYIPWEVLKRYPAPSISFVIFGYDARGYSSIP